MVERVENLSLNGVKILEGKQLLVAGVLERGDREGVEVQQLRVRGVELRENEVLERDGDDGLRSEPAVGGDADVVLGREGLEDGDGEDELLGLSGEHLRQEGG